MGRSPNPARIPGPAGALQEALRRGAPGSPTVVSAWVASESAPRARTDAVMDPPGATVAQGRAPRGVARCSSFREMARDSVMRKV